MNTLDREFRLDIPQTMNLDTFAAHFFNSAPSDDSSAAVDDLSQSVHLLNATGRATITSVANLHQHQTSHLNTINRSASVGNQFFQKIGETLFGFGGGSPAIGHNSIRVSNSEISSGSGHNMDLLRNHIVIDSSDFGTAATTSVAAAAANELQQQLEYDKFMNEIWIGIVLTLIIISMVFCICSCFLYHQFRQWKRNYRHNLQQSQDIESAKLNPDTDDPVPEYTLVSGLPSYEAALELMQKSTGRNNGNNNGSCLIVYPSALFGAFMVNEKESLLMSKAQLVDTHQDLSTSSGTTTAATDATIPQSPSMGGSITAATTTTTSLRTPIPLTENVKCQNVPRMALQQYSIPSYEEAMGCQPQPQQQQQLQQQQQFQTSDTSDTMTRTCVIKSPPPPALSHPIWSNEDISKVLLTEKKKDEK